MNQFTYQTSVELSLIDQQMLPATMADSPIFDILPPINKDVDTLEWEQQDNYFGMTHVRGLNGAVPRVLNVGYSLFQARPGYYGEEMPIDEKEMIKRRQPGTLGTPIDVQDLVAERSKYLMHRQLHRLEYLGWQLLLNGSFQVISPLSGAVTHEDSYIQRIYTAMNTWVANPASSSPLADFRAVKLLHRGYSVTFGTKAKAYMNQTTFNGLVANRNAGDLYGQRTGGLAAAGIESGMNLGQINSILLGEGLPQIVIYDADYYDANKTDQLWIPNGKVLVVGNRTDGAKLGNWVYTRNRGNPDLASGPTYKVWETPGAIPDIMVYRGFNGTHQLLFPSGFVVMNV